MSTPSTPSSPPPPLPSSIPSPASRNPSTSFFHTVKRVVLGHSSGADESEFTAARSDFLALHSNLNSLRVHVTAYLRALQAIHASSQAVTKDYADIFQDVKRPHAYSHLLLTLCQGHSSLVERGRERGGYLNPVLESISAQFELHKALLTRLEQRQQLRSDFLYYDKKVEGLLQERAKRSRPEKPGETEHIARNQTKLQVAQQRYEDFHRDLLNDLHLCQDSRLSIYGPSMEAFIDAERRFLRDYTRAMSEVEVRDAQPRLGLSLPSAANGISIQAEHSPILDGKASSPSMDDPFSLNPFGSLDPSPIGGVTPTNAPPDKKPTSSYLFDGDGPAPQFLYPYDQKGHVSASSSTPSPHPVREDPFAGLGEEVEGVPNGLVRDRMAGFSDPFVNGGGGAFYEYGAHLDPPVQPALGPSPPTSSCSSSAAAASVPLIGLTPSSASSAAPSPPEYRPAPYEIHAPPPPAVVGPVVAVAPSPALGEAEAGEEETEEEEEEGVAAHLGESEAAAAAASPSPAQPAAPGAEVAPAPPIPASPPPRPSLPPSLHPSVPSSSLPGLSPPPAVSAPVLPSSPSAAPTMRSPTVPALPTHPIHAVVHIPTPPPPRKNSINPFDDD